MKTSQQQLNKKRTEWHIQSIHLKVLFLLNTAPFKRKDKNKSILNIHRLNPVHVLLLGVLENVFKYRSDTCDRSNDETQFDKLCW